MKLLLYISYQLQDHPLMRTLWLIVLTIFATALDASDGHADHDYDHDHVDHRPHVHGVGQLAIALDGDQIAVDFALPLGDAVGFERAPESEEDRIKLAELERQLGTAATYFSDAGCSLEDLAIELGAGEDAAGHRDSRAEFVLACANPPAALTTALFDSFAAIDKIEVVVLGAEGQRSLTLERGQTLIPLH